MTLRLRKGLTGPQRQALTWARDDGSVELGGLDGRPIRVDVLERLVDWQFLKWNPGRMDLGGTRNFYTITDAGRAALAGGRS